MEQQDIRKLFGNEDDIKKPLPINHRNEFLEKLKSERQPKANRFLWLKIAAVLVIGLVASYTVFQKEIVEEESPLLSQIEAIEAEYLKNIDTEWQNFLAIAEDGNLIKRYESQLSKLNKDYQGISDNFKKDSNNILVVEALVENLRTRLQLLRDIQEHIKILNQENEHYETTI